MTPKYSPGDRIQFEPDMRHWNGTIHNVIVTNNILYDIIWDKNVTGLLNCYPEDYLSTTPQMERENKLRKLGI